MSYCLSLVNRDIGLVDWNESKPQVSQSLTKDNTRRYILDLRNPEKS